jgi:hypothetical protein
VIDTRGAKKGRRRKDLRGFRDFYHTGRILFYNNEKKIADALLSSEFHE